MNSDFNKIKELSEKIYRIIYILSEAKKISIFINAPKKKASFGMKGLVSLGSLYLGSMLISPFQSNEVLYSLLNIAIFSGSIYLGFFEFRNRYELDEINTRKKERLANQFESKWIELFKLLNDVYLNKIIPLRYLDKENLEYIIECFEYKRVDNIPDSLNMLDAKLRHEELIYSLNKIEASNRAILREIELLNEKVDVANINLNAITSSVSMQKSFQSIMQSLIDIGFAR